MTARHCLAAIAVALLLSACAEDAPQALGTLEYEAPDHLDRATGREQSPPPAGTQPAPRAP